MNKKGFTLVELVTTFALTAVIIIILLNIVLIIKDLYTKYDIKSSIIIEQSNLSSLINNKFYNNTLISYEPCFEDDDDFCYKFNFSDGSQSKLEVYDKYIIFDNYKYTAKNGVVIGKPIMDKIMVTTSNDSINNSFYIIQIPISNKLYPNEDLGINIIYPYNSNEIEL